MALRVVRHPRTRRALTAAAAPVLDPNKAFRNTLSGLASRDDWQNDAWDMLQVGELRYYVSWRSSACSRCRLVASDVDPETGLPTGSTENARFREIVKSIAGGPLGVAQVIKRATQCLTVPGEVWLAIITTLTGERWLALSKDEIHRGTRGIELDLPEGGDRYRFNPSSDSLIRVWNPNPRKAGEADSPVRATLDSLHEIIRTTKTISNASKSRLIGNGIVVLPQEVNLPPLNIPGTAGQTGTADPLRVGTPAVQQIQEAMWTIANTAYDDPDSMAALIPLMLTVPGEFIKYITHLRFDNSITDVALKTRNDAISRLAMGLDVNPERLLGMSTGNHWSSWLIADEDVALHINPVMETICQAINDQVMAPIMLREGLDPGRYVLWYDSSELTADPDQTDNATAAFTAGTITAEAYVDLLGLDSDALHDYSTREGWQRWAQDTLSAHPELATTLAPLAMGKVAAAFPELVPQSAPQPAIDAAQPEEPPANAEPQTENQPPSDQPSPVARVRSVALARNGRDIL